MSADVWAPGSTVTTVYQNLKIVTELTTARTLIASDAGSLIRCVNNTLCIVTIPHTDSVSWVVGDVIRVRACATTIGASVFISYPEGVTLNLTSSFPRMIESGQEMILTYLGFNTWDGSLTTPYRILSKSETTNFTLDATFLQMFVETSPPVDDIVCTIPTEAANNLGVGFITSGFHHGPGGLSFAGSVIILHPDTLTAAVVQYGPWTLLKSRAAADTWLLWGGLIPS